jgi:alcohol dehydrogenase (NADP+)
MYDNCNCDDYDIDNGPAMPDRRKFLVAGLGLVAAPFLTRVATGAPASQTGVPVGQNRFSTQTFGATSATTPLESMLIERRAVGPNDVLLDVLYCGICHSDIHTVRNEWVSSAPTQYPSVPGHEIIGRVQAVGSAVTKFKAGDTVGVGCMVNSCRNCESCLADLEQYCLNGATFTYNSPDPVLGGYTFGGYCDKIVVAEHFVIRIPPGADLPAMAPLLCAAITTFSPMQHWKLSSGQRVGVVGLGGLGHMAVKLAVARNADVTVFTTSPGKMPDARRLGAREVVLSSDPVAMNRLNNQFDLLIATIPQAFPMQPFVDVLKLNGTLVNVGAMEQLQGVHGMKLAIGRKSLAGSIIGGIAETQEVIDYCTARKIQADIELVRPEEINRAFERVVNKDVRFRLSSIWLRSKRLHDTDRQQLPIKTRAF